MLQKILLVWGFFILMFPPFFIFSFVSENQQMMGNEKIQEASKRIIMLMKKKGGFFKDLATNQLEKRRLSLKDPEKKTLIKNIQDYIELFLVCEETNGEWVEEHLECEYLDQKICEHIGGSYTDCASACRHQQTNLCLLPCVEVCTIQ